jgi:hypothetical protein
MWTGFETLKLGTGRRIYFSDVWILGALSLGVKRPEREADNSPPSSAEVKNAWSYTSTPQNVFTA